MNTPQEILVKNEALTVKQMIATKFAKDKIYSFIKSKFKFISIGTTVIISFIVGFIYLNNKNKSYPEFKEKS